MKKFLFAAVAATLVATPALAAAPQHYSPQRHQQVKVVKKTVYKQAPAYKQAHSQYRNDWRRGQRFDSRQARNYRQVDYRTHRNLKAPPRGYRYVQSGNDAVLVGITSGIIAAIFSGALR